jgi:hypothetical protein
MIRHVVMWKLMELTDGRGRMESAALIKTMLESLPALIPEIIRMEVGVDVVREGASWDICLIVDFQDVDALRRYQAHPEHVKVAEIVNRTREQRAVVDFHL